jgi:hypothetical protein
MKGVNISVMLLVLDTARAHYIPEGNDFEYNSYLLDSKVVRLPARDLISRMRKHVNATHDLTK